MPENRHVSHLHDELANGGQEARSVALEVEKLAEHAREVLHRHPSELEQTSLGNRLADIVSENIGSWWFISGFTLFTLSWYIAGTVFQFDPYPFQAYTMAVSVLAILMTALVLLAEQRSARIDRVRSVNEYEQVKEIRSLQDDQMRLLELQEDQMRLLREIREDMGGYVDDIPSG